MSLHQENTLVGFKRAAALGIDAVELDVRLTKDNRPVVFHDGTLERLCGIRRPISELTWDEISQIRIPRRIAVGTDALGDIVVKTYEREARISLLEEVLAEIRLPINVELKSRFWGPSIGSIVAPMLVPHRDRVMVTSFYPGTLRDVARVDPTIARGYCWEESTLGFAGLVGRRVLNGMLDGNFAGRVLGTHAVGANHTLVGKDTVRRLHAAGTAIGAHVLFPIGSPHVATPETEVTRLVGLGVNWIESDDPERLQRCVTQSCTSTADDFLVRYVASM
ncbi:MAG: glycerophosphodiester phosphodiesterase family protein [Kofleriaceae bacterium]